MAGAKIALSSTSGEFKTDGNDNARVNLPTTLSQAGYATMTGENHDGASGSSALRRSPYVSVEKKLNVGTDTVLWEDFFSHTVLNSRKYANALLTMTTAMASGLLTLNSGASAANNVGDVVNTYKSFPLMGNFPIAVDVWFGLSLTPQTNTSVIIGIGTPAAANTLPSDGIFMVLDNTGALMLNGYFNSTTPVSSGTITFSFIANRLYHLELILHRDRAEMYIDTVLYATILRGSTAGSLMQSQTGKLLGQVLTGTSPSGAQKLLLAGWAITNQDAASARPWGAAKIGLGENLISTPDSVAVGLLDNIVNSTIPGSAALSNTAAGYTTLGGNFQFAAVGGAETDYALFAYQVPTGAVAVPAKNMVITGISIDSWNMGAAVATTPTLLNWYVGVGSTAVSLATADASATRAPGRKFLGAQSFAIAAAIGARPDRWISEDYSSAPLMCEAGSFVHIILRMPIGTATASQIVRGAVTIKGYFE